MKCSIYKETLPELALGSCWTLPTKVTSAGPCNQDLATYAQYSQQSFVVL